MGIHLRKGAFWNGKHKVTPGQVRCDLGVVSYLGEGKYKDCLFRLFVELPDQVETSPLRSCSFVVREERVGGLLLRWIGCLRHL